MDRTSRTLARRSQADPLSVTRVLGELVGFDTDGRLLVQVGIGVIRRVPPDRMWAHPPQIGWQVVLDFADGQYNVAGFPAPST